MLDRTLTNPIKRHKTNLTKMCLAQRDTASF